MLLKLWCWAQVPAPNTSTQLPVKQKYPYFCTTENQLKNQTMYDFFFFPTSNTITIWLLGILPKMTAWVYCRHQNDFKTLKKSARLPKRLHFETDDSWERKQNNLHSNPSRKEFTAVSWLVATILKNCSASILENSISSSEINADALSWLVRKKGRQVCSEILFLYQLLTKSMSWVKSTQGF